MQKRWLDNDELHLTSMSRQLDHHFLSSAVSLASLAERELGNRAAQCPEPQSQHEGLLAGEGMPQDRTDLQCRSTAA